MDQNTSAVILSISVWALYVLLPLIPSIIIYKMFPETRATAEGNVGNWQIRAGGALAAYVTVVLLGYSPFARTQKVIEGMSVCTWTIHGQVSLKDNDDRLVRGNTLLKALEVTMIPDIITKQNQVVDVRIPSQGTEIPHSSLSFSIPQFGEETIDLQDLPRETKVNASRRRIDFKEIVIKEFPKTVPAVTPANLTATYQAPLSAPGPTPLATATP
jgi:hypothetical protein